MAAYTTIDDSSAHFQTTTYTGTGSSTSITNDGNSSMQPDLLWIKQRNGQGTSHMITDSSRGVGNFLFSYLTNAETNSTIDVTSFDSNGFSLGTGASVNQSGGYLYVAWQWNCNGGTTSSNTSGTITTTVQANTDAGFSIVTWAGNASNATMGHGLGATPQVIISKALGTTNDWNVYHRDLDATAPYNYLLSLHNTNARSAATGSWGTSLSDVNSNTFYKKYWINYNTNMVAYCFAEKQGYSKFGKYIGNGNANGPFVYTGFKPAFVLLKNRDTTSNWFILDTKRNLGNVTEDYLMPSSDAAESTSLDAADIDILSNGFKIRTSYSETNTSGHNITYMAFAENPFVTSTGVPTTAR